MKVLAIIAISLVLLCQVLVFLFTISVLSGLAHTCYHLSVPFPSITYFFLFFSVRPAALVHVFPLVLSGVLALHLLLKRTGQTRDLVRYLVLIMAFALIQTVVTMASFVALLAPLFILMGKPS